MSSSHLLNENIILNSKYATTINSNKNKANFELKKLILLPSNVNAYIELKNFKYSNVFYNVSENENVLWYDVGFSSIYYYFSRKL